MTQEQIAQLALASVGKGCLIETRALIFEPCRISLGDEVRIDAFSMLSPQGGSISIGNNVHIAVGSEIQGAGGVILESGSGISSGVKILSATNDYIHGQLTNPTMPTQLQSLSKAQVLLSEHVVVGVNSVILPGSQLMFGSSVGAMTLVRGTVKEFEVVAGNPMRVLGKRNKRVLLEKHQEYLEYRKIFVERG